MVDPCILFIIFLVNFLIILSEATITSAMTELLLQGMQAGLDDLVAIDEAGDDEVDEHLEPEDVILE